MVYASSELMVQQRDLYSHERHVTGSNWPIDSCAHGLDKQEQAKKEIWEGFWQEVLENPESEQCSQAAEGILGGG